MTEDVNSICFVLLDFIGDEWALDVRRTRKEKRRRRQRRRRKEERIITLPVVSSNEGASTVFFTPNKRFISERVCSVQYYIIVVRCLRRLRKQEEEEQKFSQQQERMIWLSLRRLVGAGHSWFVNWFWGRRVNKKKWPKNIEIFVSISKFLKIPKSGVCKPNHEKFRNFILRIFLETRTTFSLFFKLNNSALVHEIFGRLFSIHRVKSIQKSLNYSSYLDSIVFNRCRSARVRVSIFDEFRSVFRGNFEK